MPGGQPRLVTQAGFYGRLVSDIRLTLNRTTGDVNRSATYQATNVPVTRDRADPDVQSIVDYWNAGRPRPATCSSGPPPRPLGSSPIGTARPGAADLATWSPRPSSRRMQQAQYGSPVIAFMNPGGVRADRYIDGGEPGQVTYGEAVRRPALRQHGEHDHPDRRRHRRRPRAAVPGDPDGTGPLPPPGRAAPS